MPTKPKTVCCSYLFCCQFHGLRIGTGERPHGETYISRLSSILVLLFVSENKTLELGQPLSFQLDQILCTSNQLVSQIAETKCLFYHSISIARVTPAAGTWFCPPTGAPHSGQRASCIGMPHSPTANYKEPISSATGERKWGGKWKVHRHEMV